MCKFFPNMASEISLKFLILEILLENKGVHIVEQDDPY